MSTADFEFKLAKGFAELLASTGIGVWAENRAYAPAETGITYRSVPDSPSSLIVLSPYPVRDDVSQASATYGLQIRTRGGNTSAKTCDDLAGAIYDLLHGQGNFALSTGIHVSQVYRQSGASLGQDSAGRWGRSDNYYCDTIRPNQHRP